MQAADAAGQAEPALRRTLLMSGLSPVDRQPSALEAPPTVTVHSSVLPQLALTALDVVTCICSAFLLGQV